MREEFLGEVEERLVRYVKIDTQSDESSSAVPSTAKQLDLQRLLLQELTEMGVADGWLTDYGCVLATIPATTDQPLPTVAFLAHVDTAPAFSGTGVKPLIHRNYAGQPIVLPDDPSQILSPETIPALGRKIGEDIITASGTTLLGGDDKAGVAILMTMAHYLLRHPEWQHGPVRLCFTPDEEIGQGIRHLTTEDLGAQVAYTLDGGETGEVCFETFSADKAQVTITGVSTHPGTAQGQMVNALTLASKYIAMLPEQTRTPETTADREGFIHLYAQQGTAAQTDLHFILRDFELDGLAAHEALLRSAAATLEAGEPRCQVRCTITPQYRNMRYWLEKDMAPVDRALTCIREMGLHPITRTIRGGTDGSQLTAKGVPTPNLFTGMQNIHGPLEWISVQDMALAVEMCVRLIQID